MLNDEYGDPQPIFNHLHPETILPHFQVWLRKKAEHFFPYDAGAREDLVQEGNVAMWMMLQKFVPDLSKDYRGSIVNCVTQAAHHRMLDVTRRGAWLGTPGVRGHVRDAPGVPFEALSPGYAVDVETDALLGSAELADGIAFAYHTGRIFEALNQLTLEQREVVFRMFWHGMNNSAVGEELGISHKVVYSRWYHARNILQESLADLAGAV